MHFERKTRNRHPASLREVLKQVDKFGAELPTFNIKGQTQFTTITGGILTCMLLTIFSGYALLKLTHLKNKHNPRIGELTEHNFYDYTTQIDLSEIGFKMAFTVEGYLDSKIKDNPKYVKLLARMFYKTDGKQSEKILNMHKCTENDWSQFAEPARGQKDQLDAIKDDPERGMYCFDVDQMKGLKIYGDEKNQNHSRLEILILPCNYLHTEWGYTEDAIHPECIGDL